jgi:hypothetical protein
LPFSLRITPDAGWISSVLHNGLFSTFFMKLDSDLTAVDFILDGGLLETGLFLATIVLFLFGFSISLLNFSRFY